MPETSRTKTDEELAAAEATYASDPERAELIAHVRRFKASWFELGEALSRARGSSQFREWGFQSFEDYCKRELHLRMETVEKLTGSYGFLRKRAPEVLERDGRSGPIPSYQAVDFLRRAEEAEAPAETVREIRRHVFDEGTSLPKLSRIYRQVVFPDSGDKEESRERNHASLRHAVAKVVELVELARAEDWIPAALAAEVEEPLGRLATLLSDKRSEKKVEKKIRAA